MNTGAAAAAGVRVALQSAEIHVRDTWGACRRTVHAQVAPTTSAVSIYAASARQQQQLQHLGVLVHTQWAETYDVLFKVSATRGVSVQLSRARGGWTDDEQRRVFAEFIGMARDCALSIYDAQVLSTSFEQVGNTKRAEEKYKIVR
jgi:hypothetical protein